MRYLIKKTPITESNSDSEPFIDSDSDEETEEAKQIYSKRPDIWKKAVDLPSCMHVLLRRGNENAARRGKKEKKRRKGRRRKWSMEGGGK